MNVLHVVANPKPLAEAHSKQLAEAFFKALKAGKPGVAMTEVDLYSNPPPFYNYEAYRHFWYPAYDAAYKPTDQEKAAVKYAMAQGDLVKKADVLVLTTPMWNFGMPAILKAWLDQVIAPSLTFSMGPGGPKPLHKIRKVVVLASSGGAYAAGDLRDGVRNGVTAAMGFMGIGDVDVVWSEGQNPFFFKDHAERHGRAVNDAASLGAKIAAL